MDSEFCGIWAHIGKNSPLPERDAICRLIGIKLIDDNQVTLRNRIDICVNHTVLILTTEFM